MSDDTPDLFAGVPPLKPSTRTRREQPAELRTAASLCRRMRHAKALPEKRRIGHLICESLIALCKRSARGIR